MWIVFGLTAFILATLLRNAPLASLMLLFTLMRACFDWMRYRSQHEHHIAQRNEAIRLANMEKRKAAAKKAASVSVSDLMKHM